MTGHEEFIEDGFLVEDAIRLVEIGKAASASEKQFSNWPPNPLSNNQYNPYNYIFQQQQYEQPPGPRAVKINHGTVNLETMQNHLPLNNEPVTPLIIRLVKMINDWRHKIGRNCHINDRTF